jgi:hypothetical protein
MVARYPCIFQLDVCEICQKLPDRRNCEIPVARIGFYLSYLIEVLINEISFKRVEEVLGNVQHDCFITFW